MAIAVGSVSNTPTYATRVNSTITAPTGITNGDLLVAILHVGDGTQLPALTVTPPAGWTEVTNSPTAVDKTDPYTMAMRVYYKVAASESGNYTFTHTTADTEGFMYRLTGANTTTPIDVTPAALALASGLAGNVTSYAAVTTVTAGAFVILTEADWALVGSGTVAGSNPTITARRAGTQSWIGDGLQATAGTTTARTRVNGNNSVTGALNSPWASIVVAIRPAAAGGSPYTLPATVTTFALAGIAANTLFGHVAGAVTGTFALVGNDANLARGYKVTAVTGPFTLTGLDAATITTRTLPAAVGAFTLAGQAVNLVYTTAGAYVLGASPGAFALAGNAANLVRTNAYVLSAATGVVALAGQAANLIYAALNNYVMPAATGVFNLSGRSANLLANLLEVQPGRLEFGHVVYLRRW